MGTRLKQFEKFYKVAIVLVDLLLINVAYVLAFLIKFDFSLPDFNFTPYMEAMPFITVAALVYLDIYGLLKFYRKTFYDAVISVFFVVFLLGITTVAITYFKQGFSFPRSVLIIAPIIQFVLLLCWKGFILWVRKKVSGRAKMMIVGTPDDIDHVVGKVRLSADVLNIKVNHVTTSTNFNDIKYKMREVSEVLICAGVSNDLKMEIMSYCMTNKKIVYIVPQLFEISILNARMVQFEDMPAFMIDGIGLTIEQRFFKRIFDIVIAFTGSILSSPIMLFAAIAVKGTSKGPILYTQERVTFDNKVFKIYKFRTMAADAEDETGPVISGGDDPRVTRVGKFLRKYRIDELPQLVNVLGGDMSFVGPRSERPYFVEQFSKEIPGYSHRANVKAGLTGFAQVLGSYDTTPEDKLRYDLIYIRNYSLLLDIKLIMQTVKVVFTGNTVYNKSFEENAGAINKIIKA